MGILIKVRFKNFPPFFHFLREQSPNRTKGGCFDRDECQSTTMNSCDQTYAKCENNPGSYYCIPHVGFMLGPNGEIVGEVDS